MPERGVGIALDSRQDAGRLPADRRRQRLHRRVGRGRAVARRDGRARAGPGLRGRRPRRPAGGDHRPGVLLRLRRQPRPAAVSPPDRGRCWPARPTWSSAAAGRSERDAWPLPARLANWELARRVRRRTGLGIRDLGPMRAAGREALLSLNLADRRFGYPLEMVMNAAAAGWRVSEVEVTYLPRIGKSKVTGTVRRLRAHRAGHEPGTRPVTAPAPESATTLLVIAKQPVPGRVKTRLVPPCTHEQAAALAEAALADTLHTVLMAPARRRVLVLEGEPGPWLPAGFDVVPQCGGPLDERLAGAFAAVRGPALLIGMDTPQVTPGLLDRGLAGRRRRVRPGRRRRILGARPARPGSRPAARCPHVDPEHRRHPASPAARGRAARRRSAATARRGHGGGCRGRGPPGTAEPFRRAGAGARRGPEPGRQRHAGSALGETA